MKGRISILRGWGAPVAGLVALASFAFILFAARQLIYEPSAGALWNGQSIVFYAASTSTLESGDQFVTDAGAPLPLWEVEESFEQLLRTRTLPFTEEISILRQGELEQILVRFDTYITAPLLFFRLVPVVVALAFWLVSVFVLGFSARDNWQSVLFAAFGLLMAIILASGGTRGWPRQLYVIAIWFFTPVALHFHYYFPAGTKTGKVRIISALYLVAFVGMTPALAILFSGEGLALFSGLWRAIYTGFYFLWLIGGLGGILAIMLYRYRVTSVPQQRRQIGLVLLSAVIGILPVLTLALIPDLLTGAALVPYEALLLFLVTIPMGYGYAVMRFHFIRMERYVSRSATLLIVVLCLAAISILLDGLLRSITSPVLQDHPITRTVTVLALTGVATVTFPRLRVLVDMLFYGGWYDYSSVVERVSILLEQPRGIDGLADTLSETIRDAMRVEWVSLILPRDNGSSAIGVAGIDVQENLLQSIRLDAATPLLRILRERLQPMARAELLDQLDVSELNDAELALLTHSRARLLVPIPGYERALGLLILGPRVGRNVFDAADLRIVDVVARQASFAFQISQLIAELEMQAVERDTYQRQVNHAREEERRRLARELHDEVIQALIGFKYGLSNVQGDLVQQNGAMAQTIARTEQLQQEVGELVQVTRNLCLDLRPPALDLGLVPSIRSVVNRFEVLSAVDIVLTVKGERDAPVSEDAALCLFRCTQEALQNVIKHAEAQHIEVELDLRSTVVKLSITDDGVGFDLPERLGTLMVDNHFGLVGMRERIDLLDGTFEVESKRELGTRITAHIPLV